MRRAILFCAAAVAAATATPARAAEAPPPAFYAHPVQSLHDESLTDQKDTNYAALRKAYRKVTLTDLDGSGTLTGRYAKVLSNTGHAATAPFIYMGDDERFEQVMGYY